MDQSTTGNLKLTHYFLLNQLIFPELRVDKNCRLHDIKQAKTLENTMLIFPVLIISNICESMETSGM